MTHVHTCRDCDWTISLGCTSDDTCTWEGGNHGCEDCTPAREPGHFHFLDRGYWG